MTAPGEERQEGEKLLIVDDDLALTRVLQRALGRRGYQVEVAQSAREGLRLSEATGFQKAILDLKLAESSGLQLIPQLLERQPGLQIVMLTGYSSIATAVRAIKLGASNYLAKPAGTEEILAAFEEETQPADPREADGLKPPSVDRLQWEHIQRVLREHNDNISATARALGMHRRTLQRKLNKKPVKG